MPGFGWLEIHAVDHCNNKCKYCNNMSPYASAKSYSVDEYLPFLDILQDNRVGYYCISVLGGEPFLHKDLTSFMAPLRKYNKSNMLTTNGFWLSEKKINQYNELFKSIDILCFSIYPSIVERHFESKEHMLTLIDMIKEQHQHLRVDVRDVESFTKFEFLETPVVVDRFCGTSDCVALLADGRMARCNVGAYAHLSPSVTQEFLDNKDVFYDLHNFDTNSFWMWRKRWPMDACSYCTAFLGDGLDWEYESRIPPRKSVNK